MRILVAAAAALVLLGSASANAQSLEQTYADLCSDPAKAKSESCVALAQALIAKLQGRATSTSSPTPTPTLAAPASATSPQQTMEQRWGLYLGLVDKKLVDVLVGGNVPYEFPAAIVTFAWDIPGQVLSMSHVQIDGSTTKMATLRWDEDRGGLVETSLADGAEGLLLVPQADGSHVAFTPSGSRITLRKIENDAIEVRTESNLGNRWDLGWLLHRVPFTPESFDLLKQIHANSQNGARLSASMDPKYRDPDYLRLMAERAAAARAAKAERRAERAAMFGAVVQGVAQGVAEIDTGGYAEAQANLDATVADIQAAAAAEASGRSLSAPAPAPVARALSPSPSPTQPQYAPAPAASTPTAAESNASSGAGAPLRFILQIGLKTVINGRNASCYSNIVTIPGPPGWPDPSRQQEGTMPARALIEAYMPAFKAQCSAIAPLANGEPNYHWNLKGSEHISPESQRDFGQSHGFPFVQL